MIEVSAILVATTILRVEGGSGVNILFWAEDGSPAYKGRIWSYPSENYSSKGEDVLLENLVVDLLKLSLGVLHMFLSLPNLFISSPTQ